MRNLKGMNGKLVLKRRPKILGEIEGNDQRNRTHYGVNLSPLHFQVNRLQKSS